MSNVELGFFLVGGVSVLLLVLYSLRVRDLEQRGNAALPFGFGLLFALLFLSFGGRLASLGLEMSDAQRVAGGVAAGCFSASAILMLSRAYQMRKSRRQR